MFKSPNMHPDYGRVAIKFLSDKFLYFTMQQLLHEGFL